MERDVEEATRQAVAVLRNETLPLDQLSHQIRGILAPFLIRTNDTRERELQQLLRKHGWDGSHFTPAIQNPDALAAALDGIIGRQQHPSTSQPLSGRAIAYTAVPSATGLLPQSHSTCLRVHPPAVRPKSKLAIIAPAGRVKENEHDLRNLRERLTAAFATIDIEVVFAQHAFGRYGFLAGTDEERAEDLHWAFQDKSISAILALRGGWGCARLLKLIDWRIIQNNPKPFIGYSDLTSLLNAITHKTKLITFHGPMGISSWESMHMRLFKTLIMQQPSVMPLELAMSGYTPIVIHEGIVEGRLVGGNLAVFCATMGSEYFPTLSKKSILILEDITELPYRIDRMLTQLSLSGALETVGGIIFGQFTRCDPPDAVPPTFEVLDLVNQHTAKLGIPVIYGVPIGHIEQQWLLPIGGKVRLVARAGSSKVELLEAPCQSANVTVRGEAEFSSCFETANQSTNAIDIYEHKNVSHLNLWNSEYQLIASVNWSASDGILESLKNDSGVNVSKEQLRAALLTISKQSWSAAVGRKITSLMNKTVVDKPLRPVEVGGVLGGSKFEDDSSFLKSAEVCGPFTEVWQARKSLGNELRALNTLVRAVTEISARTTSPIARKITKLRFPMASLVEICGKRSLVMTRLPIDESTLRLGASQVTNVKNDDALLFSMVDEIATWLNLKKHRVGRSEVFLRTPGDLEGHLGLDDFYYLVDFSRLLCPEARSFKGSTFTYVLRPEAHLLQGECGRKLNPDAYCSEFSSAFDRSIPNIEDATLHLYTRLLALALKIDEVGEEVLLGPSTLPFGSLIVSMMHEQGINLRLLGVLRAAVKTPRIKSAISREMLQRTMKQSLRDKLAAIGNTQSAASVVIAFHREAPSPAEALMLLESKYMYFREYSPALFQRVSQACGNAVTKQYVLPSADELNVQHLSIWSTGAIQGPIYDKLGIEIKSTATDATGLPAVTFELRHKLSNHVDFKPTQYDESDAAVIDSEARVDAFSYTDVQDLARLAGNSGDQVRARLVRAIAKSDSIKELVQISPENVVSIINPATKAVEFTFQLCSQPLPAPPGPSSAFPKNSALPLAGYRIALDPAFLSGSMNEVAIETESMGSVRTGELNLQLALVLKYKLELLGAEIWLTRTPNRMCSGQTWREWCDAPRTRKLGTHWIQMIRQNLHEYYDKLIATIKTGDPRAFVEECHLRILKQLDRSLRAGYINSVTPDISVHFCFGPADEQKAFFACTPGSFCENECLTRRSRMDMARLLLTNAIERSERLCTAIAEELEKGEDFMVPRPNKQNEKWLLPLGHPGVNARNLQTPRLVRVPSSFLCLLYPTHDIKALSDLTTLDQDVDIAPQRTIKTSVDIVKIADRVADGLVKYFNS